MIMARVQNKETGVGACAGAGSGVIFIILFNPYLDLVPMPQPYKRLPFRIDKTNIASSLLTRRAPAPSAHTASGLTDPTGSGRPGPYARRIGPASGHSDLRAFAPATRRSGITDAGLDPDRRARTRSGDKDSDALARASQGVGVSARHVDSRALGELGQG